ncbi:MAG: hypothetical protein GY832_29010 [Chloroflexi bacterium]|nr:hypothetical protein [Chloroflexota bacterium]
MKGRLIVMGVLSSVLLIGCATPTMVVPADVLGMQADEIVATERKKASGAFVNESFVLGPYAVEDVDRDWDSTRSVGVSSFSSEKTTSGYSYTFKTENGDMKGVCLIEGKSKALSMFGGVSMAKSVSRFGCSCDAAGAKAEVVLDSKNDSEYEGTVSTRSGDYTIKAIYEAEGSLPTGNPSGYRVDGDAVVAATDVLYPGKVWFGKDLSEEQRDDLACVFTGLMLYQGKKD